MTAVHRFWDVANDSRLRDMFILDVLIRLALDDGSTKPRTLQEIALQWAGLDLTDPPGAHFRFGQRLFGDLKHTQYDINEYVVVG